MTLAPSAAKARAMARPMPLVEPVTRAFLDLQDHREASFGLGRSGGWSVEAGVDGDGAAPAWARNGLRRSAAARWRPDPAAQWSSMVGRENSSP